MRTLASILLLSLSLSFAPACGGGGGPEKLDVAALKAGSGTTAKLKFWMKEKGVRGNGMADNIHFDDSANVRVVLYYDPSLQGKVDALEQNRAYKVTFTPETTDKMIVGTLTSLE